DPAHSLRDSLAEAASPARLTVLELQAQEHLDDFKRRHGQHLREIADRGTFLDAEDIDRFISLSLPGMDELFAFLDIARRAQAATDEDCVVVDTAPTGHTMRLLAMPELLRGWVETLDTLLAKHRYMKSLFGRSYTPDELDAFLDELEDSITAAEGLLRDRARCRFVPVMIAEELSVRETASLLEELDRLGIAADEVVLNGLAPADGCAVCVGTHLGQMEELRDLPKPFARRTLWGVPLYPEEVRGIERLETFWGRASRLERPPRLGPVTAPEAMPPAHADNPAPLPPDGMKLLLFAGKGGVGKTTLACATALRLARERPERQILLFSSDPAHSLGDCLDLPVGPEPTPVTQGLTALEIDAQAEFGSLKEQYREEIDEFFGSMLGSLDMPFDREVMEQLFELSPPGVDEIMALSRAMDFLEEGRYDLFILDSAPSGHLLRLLELPGIVDSWLKALFELFLKYR
ncbi:MAG: ArsA family ATPase, partial [Polyangiaceae bacterium]|nr:ArsA family ATPase [Polyangiaceae bacterium]